MVCADFQDVALRAPTLSTAPSLEPLDLRLPFLSVILIKCQKYGSALFLPLRGNSSRCGSRVSEFPIFTTSLPSHSSLSCWLFDPFMKIFLFISSDFEGCLQNSLVCRKWKWSLGEDLWRLACVCFHRENFLVAFSAPKPVKSQL